MDGAKDPLRLDGEFSQREKTFWSPGDQVRPFKREDNLRMEGDFTLRREKGQGSKERKNARAISDSITMPSLFTKYTSQPN